jgi:hypothetical protein
VAKLEIYSPDDTVSNLKFRKGNQRGIRMGIPAGSTIFTISETDNLASSNWFNIDSSGNVGIGTTSPAYNLDVSGDIRATGTIYGASGTQVPVGTGTENYLSKWSASGTLGDSVVYENSGNVGIGTTTPGNALDVIGSISASGSVTAGTAILNGSTGIYLGSSGRGRYGFAPITPLGAYPLTLYSGNSTYTDGYINFNVAGSERVRIDSSGNVGIGTANPTKRLEVVDNSSHGTENLVNTLDSGYAAFEFWNNSGVKVGTFAFSNPSASVYPILFGLAQEPTIQCIYLLMIIQI